MKAKVDKLDIEKLVVNQTVLHNLKTKVDDLDVGKLKTVPVDLKNSSDRVCKEVVKNTKLRKLNMKANSLENRIWRKNGDVNANMPNVSDLVSTTVSNTKIGEVENKIPDSST